MTKIAQKKKIRKKRVVKGWCERVNCAIFHICNRVPKNAPEPDDCEAYLPDKIFRM